MNMYIANTTIGRINNELAYRAKELATYKAIVKMAFGGENPRQEINDLLKEIARSKKRDKDTWYNFVLDIRMEVDCALDKEIEATIGPVRYSLLAGIDEVEEDVVSASYQREHDEEFASRQGRWRELLQEELERRLSPSVE